MVAFLTAPVTVPVFKSSAEYSVFNTSWIGTSNFARLAYMEGKNVVPIFGSFDTVNIADRNGVLVIIGPKMEFTGDEIEEIKTFLERGNTLFIADDFGTANDIFKGLFNFQVGLSKYPLKDFFYETDDRLVISVRIEDPILARNVTKIVTNEPSAIIAAPSAEAFYSKVSVINYRRSMYPLLAEIKYGKGRVVILADPDILINQLYEENEPFLRNLIEYLGGGTFYIDEAHHPDFNLYTVTTMTITRYVPRDTLIMIMVIIAAIILLWELKVLDILWRFIWKFLSRLFRRKESIEDIALRLAKERGWDEKEVMEMLERIGG